MKRFTDIFIKRPVMASVISLLIFLTGCFSLFHLPVRLFPKITDPVITITTSYPGASSQVMQGYVTSVIENSLSGIDGLNYMTASSSQGTSVISLYMDLGYSPQEALSSVMSKVSAVTDQLPVSAQQPTITLGNAENPAMILAFTSEKLQRRQVADYLRRVVEPKLEAIPGIAQAQVLGRTYAMRLWLNPIKMAARNISAQEVARAIENGNVQAASGTIENTNDSFDVQTTTNLHSENQFNNVYIKSSQGAYVRLKDIGHASLGDADNSISAYYNGKPATMIFVKLLPGANPVTVTDAIKAQLPEINKILPFDMKVHNVVDAGRYINGAITEVVKTLIEATIIVLLIIWGFLRSFRAMLIPVITIPLSLVGVCSLLYAIGYSINTLTLLAMVLAIGLVVDDAIVVVENTYHHIEAGKGKWQAALVGAREIAYPVIAMSLTLAAVYAPIALTGGLTGQLFSEFAITLAVSVIISGVIALTLSPMLSSRWLPESSLIKNENKIKNILDQLQFRYTGIINWFLNRHKWQLGLWGFVVIATAILFVNIPSQLAPEEDQGLFVAISSAPDYTSKAFLNYYALELNKVYRQFKVSDSQVIVTGIPVPHQAISFISLKPWGKRSASAMTLLPRLQEMVNQIPGIQTIIINPPTLPGSDGLPFQIVLKSTLNFKDLNNIANMVMNKAQQSGLFSFIQSDLKYDQPTLHVEINRNAAEVLGISMQEIASTLNLMLGGNHVQQFVKDGRSYFVIPQVLNNYRLNPKQLYEIHFKTTANKMVPLSSIATIHISTEPESLNQFQKLNAVTLSGEMTPGKSMEEGIGFIKHVVNSTYSNQINIDYAGQTRQFVQEAHRMLWVLLAAIVFIFLILAMQFESYRSPLIILLGSVPFAVFGACLALWLGFGTMNIYTEIGLVTLIGLISKHGILITEFANKLQQEGESKSVAIRQAVIRRFRPILMTTLAIVLGVLPLVFASGAGSVSRAQLGIVILMGMIFGTILTLLVLPGLYMLMAPSVEGAPK